MPRIEELRETVAINSPRTQGDLLALAKQTHIRSDRIRAMYPEQHEIMLSSFTSPSGSEWVISKNDGLHVQRVKMINGEEYIDVVKFIQGGMVIKGWSIVASQINGEITQLRGTKALGKARELFTDLEKDLLAFQESKQTEELPLAV